MLPKLCGKYGWDSLRLIERMPAKPKQQLLGLIDTFIAANSKS